MGVNDDINPEVEEHFRDAIAAGLVDVHWIPGEWHFSLTEKAMEAVSEEAVRAAVVIAAEALSVETGLPGALCADLIMNYDMSVFDHE